jgi:Right handed beta helix region
MLIQDCKIDDGGLCGIYTAGEFGKQVILRCRISNIRGIGIRIHRLNKTKVKGCEIQRCITGIEVLSADPYIIFNNIHNIWENGILIIAKNGLRCYGLVKMNRVY